MSSSQPAIVYLVDDDAAVLDSLSLLFATADLQTECHASAESFLAAYRPEQPGCLVLDMRMQRMSGAELQAELNQRGSQLPVIFLTAYGDIPMTVNAMKAGAVDFLTKPVDGAALLDRVQATLRLDAATRRQHEQQREQQALQLDRMALLTRREREVLNLALAGQPNKIIAQQLGISHRTVEVHRSNILSKTSVNNLLELAQQIAGIDPAPESGESLAPPG
jgi:FixJ family two-component response regulator